MSCRTTATPPASSAIATSTLGEELVFFVDCTQRHRHGRPSLLRRQLGLLFAQSVVLLLAEVQQEAIKWANDPLLAAWRQKSNTPTVHVMWFQTKCNPSRFSAFFLKNYLAHPWFLRDTLLRGHWPGHGKHKSSVKSHNIPLGGVYKK